MKKVISKKRIVKIFVLIAILLFAMAIKGIASNAANTAKLNIQMNVQDDRFDILDATICNIYIYLNDGDNNPIDGNFSYSGDESGTVTFTQGKGEIILHGASSTVRLEGLPEGATYKVELRKYGCWYNEKTSSGKEGILGNEEKTASITCTVNTMDQKVIAVIDMVDKAPWIADNNFEYYLGSETCVPQPKEGVLYYTGTDEVKKLEIDKSDRGYLRVSSQVVLEDDGVAVLHNVPYNRDPQTFRRRDSELRSENYGFYGNEGFIVYGENEFEENDSRKLRWAGTSGISGEYVVMRVGEDVGYVSNLVKLYARQNENGEIVTVEPSFDGGEDDKEHTFRVRMYYHSSLGEDHNFYVKNYVLPILITTVGSGEAPVEDTIKLDENGEAYIKLKANQTCKFGMDGGSVRTIPYDYSSLSDVEFDDDGNLIIDARFHSVSDKMLSIPHSSYNYYGELEIEEVQEDGNEIYTVNKFVGEEVTSFYTIENNYLSDYILANSADYQYYLWWLPFSTTIINTRNFTGELNVAKEVEGEIDSDKEYTFKIKFEDNASDLKDFYMNNIYIVKGDEKTHLELNENYEGTFTLKAGERISIVSDCENLQKGLPVGARYTITEEDYSSEELETISENAEGKVKNGIINVKFTNKKKEPEPENVEEPEDPAEKPEAEEQEDKDEGEEIKSDEKQTETEDSKETTKTEKTESEVEKQNPQTGDILIKIAVACVIVIGIINVGVYIKRKK